jgi:hypothetical protein
MGFPEMGIPPIAEWFRMVYFMENPRKWMITGGTPHFTKCPQGNMMGGNLLKYAKKHVGILENPWENRLEMMGT